MRRRRSLRMQPSGASALGARLASMIDIVFLLLMYFLLIAGFTRPEADFDAAVAASAAADPFELPPQPIEITVRTRGDAPDAFALITRGMPGASPTTAAELDAALVEATALLSQQDQVFALSAGETTRWEHVLETFNVIRRQGYERVRFAEPER